MDATGIIERLRGSAVWRQAEAEAEADRVTDREEAVARVESAEKKFAKVAPGLRKAVEQAQVKRDKLAGELDSATAALQAATSALRDASARLDGIRSREHAFLRRTAFQAVDDFETELRKEFERARGLTTVTEGGRRNRITGAVSGGSWNWPAITSYSHALLRAMQHLDRLRLIPDPKDLEEAIQEVRDGLPDPTEMTPMADWRAA